MQHGGGLESTSRVSPARPSMNAASIRRHASPRAALIMASSRRLGARPRDGWPPSDDTMRFVLPSSPGSLQDGRAAYAAVVRLISAHQRLQKAALGITRFARYEAFLTMRAD